MKKSPEMFEQAIIDALKEFEGQSLTQELIHQMNERLCKITKNLPMYPEYEVVCDETNNSKEDIAQGIINVSYADLDAQLTLGELTAILKKEDPRKELYDGFMYPHCYRGYYDQVAFEPTGHCNVEIMLDACKHAFNGPFTGWKGGEYMFHENTPCWLAVEGTTKESVMLTRRLLKAMLDNTGVPSDF